MDEKFMREAIIEAKKAYEKGEVPVGAVIVYKNEIIGRGHNLVESKKNPLYHAELIAIDKASKRLNGWRLLDTSMYVTLEPCPMCAGAIINARIPRLILGALDEKRGCVVSRLELLDNEDLNHRVRVEKGVLTHECSHLISKFFSQLREK